jgi:molybdate transport system ATP-binding protein
VLDFHLLKALHTAAGPRTLDVRLTLVPGELLAISGPSGAGKTTLLRLLAGLDRPDGGFIRAENQTWYRAEGRQWLPPQQRPLGFVFQDYALFPNMTVRQNLAFAASGQPQPARIIRDLLESLELTELAERRPAVLSGGQQQRVALARAPAPRPPPLLRDEPHASSRCWPMCTGSLSLLPSSSATTPPKLPGWPPAYSSWSWARYAAWGRPWLLPRQLRWLAAC